MTDRYQNKYRIASARVPWHAYDGGVYFVTICTAGKQHYLGEIVDASEPYMQLSAMGEQADVCWRAIPEHFPHVELGDFVVMPNHVHGIVIIHGDDAFGVHPSGGTQPLEETQNFASLPACANRFAPQSRNLASVIRGFKVGVTRYAREHRLPFGWQPRFYDHIVRNQNELNRIAQYIADNPVAWATDELNIGI